ncbi:MAG: FAD-binding domain-containing protein, partial [Gammaproteobacteria bacterium]
MDLVWFKRDLRVDDHAPLAAAAARGPCVCLYVYEPDLIAAPDHHASHLEFVNESLAELDRALRVRGGRLLTREGAVTGVLGAIHRECPFARILAHQETGNGLSFARDRAVIDWARAHGVELVEYRQHGVIRRLADRSGWSREWERLMRAPAVPAPGRVEDGAPALASAGILPPAHFDLVPGARPGRQAGGSTRGEAVLRDFLAERGEHYRTALSSPLSAGDACSRLSPYLAYGNVSLRRVYQASIRRRRELDRAGGRNQVWSKSLESFAGRLHWHCHFMQKLEDEPRIEFENMNRAFDGLREDAFNEIFFERWTAAETGYPLVDACLRALAHTGWINFRMRAMLVSFASYHLWLHWRRPALHLAQLFLDYEPGIHYPQVQMQSGTTGINAVRIYSPIKQVHDQDPRGEFIRRWIPALAGVPDEFIAEPARMPRALQARVGCLIGRDYPAPVVE